jgi:sterol desaturase/sphingolipid hydroxylase (fatty acid hydroxylase superfamily)
MDILQHFLNGFGRSLAAYLLLCGGAYLVVWLFLKKKLAKRRLQARPVPRQQIREEIKWSLVTFAVWAANGVAVTWLAMLGKTTFYLDVEAHGRAYLVVSFLILTVIQDAWFYWTHRLMHHPRLFKAVHATHHKFRNPSPWASFALGPIEAQIQYGYVYVIVLTVPVHPYVFAAVLPIYFAAISILHLGYEIWPRWFPHRVFTTSTHHNLHHQELTTNFGAAYTFWDTVMRTTSKRYDGLFREMTVKDACTKAEPRPSSERSSA